MRPLRAFGLTEPPKPWRAGGATTSTNCNAANQPTRPSQHEVACRQGHSAGLDDLHIGGAVVVKIDRHQRAGADGGDPQVACTNENGSALAKMKSPATSAPRSILSLPGSKSLMTSAASVAKLSSALR